MSQDQRLEAGDRQRTTGPLRLLLVEDSDGDAALFEELISQTRFIASPLVVRTRSIAEASARIAQDEPNCVLLDLGLPDAIGLSGLNALRRLSPHAAIVMLTGYDDEAMALEAVRTGAQDYVVKDQADDRILGRTILRSVQRQELVSAMASQKRDADYEARHDVLTGLYNRRHVEQQLAERTAAGSADTWELVLLDLDGFKAINDSLGHAAGDEILREVGRRLRLAIRPGDVAARLGGDEFVLLVQRTVADMPARLRTAIESPIHAGGAPHRVSASVGVSVFPTDGRDAKALLEAADQRMYADKRSRRPR